MHFKGKANTWYKYYQTSKLNMHWKTFQADVVMRFENLEQRDVQDQFKKLKQPTSVVDYEDQFEELRAMVMHKNMGGLKEPIKVDVRMFRPQTLSDAIFLAKQEVTRVSRSTYQSAKGINTKFPTQHNFEQKM